MKKVVSLFLASLLSLSLFAFAPVTPTPPQGPDPDPVVTIQPGEPDKPGQLPAEPQDDPPPPKPIDQAID